MLKEGELVGGDDNTVAEQLQQQQRHRHPSKSYYRIRRLHLGQAHYIADEIIAYIRIVASERAGI